MDRVEQNTSKAKGLVIRDLEARLGAPVHVRANLGRSQIFEADGVLDQVHSGLFVVRLNERGNTAGKRSFSYVDVLTGTVELLDPVTGQNLLEWLDGGPLNSGTAMATDSSENVEASRLIQEMQECIRFGTTSLEQLLDEVQRLSAAARSDHGGIL